MKQILPLLTAIIVASAPMSAMGQDRAAAVGIEQDHGVWWFRSAAGGRFLSIGANHVEPLYWQSPRNADFVRETYGGEVFRKDGSFDDGQDKPYDEQRWRTGTADGSEGKPKGKTKP